MIGSLRHQVTIEEPTDASDGQGGTTRTWIPILSAWAAIEPKVAIVRLASGKVETDTSHKVTLRYRADVELRSEMRVKHTVGSLTRYFSIHGLLNEDERNRYVTLLCKEGVAR